MKKFNAYFYEKKSFFFSELKKLFKNSRKLFKKFVGFDLDTNF